MFPLSSPKVSIPSARDPLDIALGIAAEYRTALPHITIQRAQRWTEGAIEAAERIAKAIERSHHGRGATTPAGTIAKIATVSQDIAWQAGVGGMETAGSIISYLAEHPEEIDAFMAGGSVLEWPSGWHKQGCLSWHGQDGKIHHPEAATGESAIPQGDAQ